MFKIPILVLTSIFLYVIYIELSNQSNNDNYYPTLTSFLEVSEDEKIDYPFNFFAGKFLILDKTKDNYNSTATAFSVSSQRGYWMTAAHAVTNCWGVLLDKDGTDWVFADEVVIHPFADIALLKAPVSAPSFVSLSKDSWIPRNGYIVGYSGNKINFANAEVVGWTKAYDKNEDYVYDVIVWKPEILLDHDRTFGMSGSPIMDYNNNVLGVVVAIDAMGYFASVPTYFIDNILSQNQIDVKKLEVPTEDFRDIDFFANNITRYETNGSIKQIQCIRKPSDYIKNIVESYNYK